MQSQRPSQTCYDSVGFIPDQFYQLVKTNPRTPVWMVPLPVPPKSNH